MKQLNIPPRRPVRKILNTAGANNIQGLQNQQGSSYSLFDAIAITAGQQFYNFFAPAGRSFPFTNVDNGQLPISDALSLQTISFGVLTSTGGSVTAAQTFAAAGIDGMYASQFSIKVANNEIVQKYSLLNLYEAFNPFASTDDNDVIHMRNLTVIPPQTQFEITLQAADLVAAPVNGYIFCKIEGYGIRQAYKQ